MLQRIGRRKYQIYAFDIETHNDPVSIKRKETSMWLGCLIDDTSDPRSSSSYLYNMDEFMQRIDALTSKKRHNSKETRPCNNLCIYVYNLSFEYSFLLPYMIKYGFKFKEHIEKDDEFVFNSVTTKSVSSVWMVQMKFHKNSGLILLKDLAKIYGGGLGSVAKAFDLPTQKGSINYRKNRLSPNYKPTCKELYYCFCDTRIIIDILLKMQEQNDVTFFKVTSMASYSMHNLLKEGFFDWKPYKAFRAMYPFLDEEETNFLRKGVEGGICYAVKEYQFKEINQKICHIDAHQMHPSQMAKRYFPKGKGEYGTGKPDLLTSSKIYACRIKISYTDVKLHSIIKLIGQEYVSDVELTVWSFEIPTMKKCYNDLTIEYIDYYAYDIAMLPFRNYIKGNYKKRLEAKTKGDKFNTLRYKLLNNTPYGKLLEKPHNFRYINTVNEYGMIDSIVEEKDFLDQEISAKYTYIPVGSCIPAYSRVVLVETALKIGWENVVYFDTDSIFFIWNDQTQKVLEEQINLKDELGGWAIEEFIDRAQFTAPKRYKTETDGKTVIKAGGINFENMKLQMKESHVVDVDDYRKVEIPFDEINIINNKVKVQRAYRVKGGTIIEFQTKEIQVPKKYETIYTNYLTNN